MWSYSFLVLLIVCAMAQPSTPAEQPQHEILQLKDSDVSLHIGADAPAFVLFYYEVDSIRLQNYRTAFLNLAKMLSPDKDILLGMVDMGLNPAIKDTFSPSLAQEPMYPKVAFFPAHSSRPQLFHHTRAPHDTYDVTTDEMLSFINSRVTFVPRPQVPELMHSQHRFANTDEKGEGLSTWRTWVVILLGAVGISTFLYFTAKLKEERTLEKTD